MMSAPRIHLVSLAFLATAFGCSQPPQFRGIDVTARLYGQPTDVVLVSLGDPDTTAVNVDGTTSWVYAEDIPDPMSDLEALAPYLKQSDDKKAKRLGQVSGVIAPFLKEGRKRVLILQIRQSRVISYQLLDPSSTASYP